jgi:transcriptional regulator with XRE-family HTH domain
MLGVRSPHYHLVITQLVEARRAANMTQRDLATAIGKPPSFIGKIESGERRLDVVEVIAIARALGRDPGRLLGEIGDLLPEKISI